MENKGRNADGTFIKGSSEAGRKEGSIGKFTSIKQDFLNAYNDERIGGLEGLVGWILESKRNKAMFYQWLTRMLPTSISGDVKGDITLTVKKVTTDERPDERVL